MSWKTIREISFEGATGARLAARLDRPVLEPRAFALFAHCFTCSKDIHAATRISRELASRGIATLRFDFTGLGHSEGEFANTDFSSNVADLLAAVAWLREHFEGPGLLIGHSLGGAAVLAAADEVKEARAVVTIGAPSDVKHIEKLLTSDRQRIEDEGVAELELGGRRFKIRREFLEDLRSQNIRAKIGKLRKALLVMHAVTDSVVGIDHAAEIFDAARHPKSFVSLDQADHLVSRREDAEFVASVVAAWAGRYLPARDDQIEPDEGEVVVEETGTGRFTQHVQVGPHSLLGDEPRGVGGDDLGPTPYGYLLAALGTCTSMTLRMYAEHKKIALDRVRVHLRHAKVHAEDCESCETGSGLIDRIEREIRIEGDLDEAQRRRLLEIADRCPVHRTLHSEVSIETRQAGP